MNDLSQRQQWAFEFEYGYMQNVGSGRCLIPNVSDDSSIKVRLAVSPCPVGEDDSFKWRFSNGLIAKVEKASFQEPEFVIEAARAIKRSGGRESVILIPVLSNVDNSKIDFQSWDRVFVT
jgi:hypothetical protein